MRIKFHSQPPTQGLWPALLVVVKRPLSLKKAIMKKRTGFIRLFRVVKGAGIPLGLPFQVSLFFQASNPPAAYKVSIYTFPCLGAEPLGTTNPPVETASVFIGFI